MLPMAALVLFYPPRWGLPKYDPPPKEEGEEGPGDGSAWL